MSRLQSIFRPIGTGQAVAHTSGASTPSANTIGNGLTGTDPARVQGVYVYSDTDVWMEVGASPTAAATTSTLVPGGVPMVFSAGPGDKVAVRSVSASGTAWVRAVADD